MRSFIASSPQVRYAEPAATRAGRIGSHARPSFGGLLLASALAATAGQAFAQAPIGSAFTYQAQIKNNGQPLNATADLEFRLFNDVSAGAQVGPTVSVLGANVANGLLTAQLDFGIAPFDGDARWIEIAVRSPAGGGAYTTLAPRQPLTAMPYAQHAISAENGGVLTIDNGQPGVMWTRSPNGTDVFLSGSVNAGFGFSSPIARLHVRAPAGLPPETARVEDVFGRSQLRIATPESAGRAELQAWNGQTNTAGPLVINVGGGNVGIGTNAPASRLDVAGSFEADSFRLNGNGAAAGRVLKCDAGGNASWQDAPVGSQWTTSGSNIGYTAGNVGVGTTSPHSSFRLQTTGGSGVWRGAIAATGATNSAVMGELSGVATVGGHNAALTAWADLALNPAGGNVGIGTTTPASKLDVAGTLTSDGLAVIGHGSVTGNFGIGTATPSAKLEVIGTAKVQVLTITGGSDVAEPFNINSCETARCSASRVAASGCADVQPGLVVAIDPTRVGELRLSSTAYDKTVAGIISGANGVNPGMVLTQSGTVADGKHPVALTGRVWCWCDADAGGAITAGDMLTTSNTPGHAMRVGDHDRANGAVIGKAMSSLESGQGLVLVLVNLQ